MITRQECAEDLAFLLARVTELLGEAEEIERILIADYGRAVEREMHGPENPAHRLRDIRSSSGDHLYPASLAKRGG